MKLLDRAGQAIGDEVIAGPDAATVRKAVAGPAKDGLRLLDPIVKRVLDRREAGYKAFEDAGVVGINVPDYVKRMQAAALEARKSRSPMLADAIEYAVDDLRANAAKLNAAGAPLGLRALRAWTTDVQGKAASAIGGLNLHQSAKLKAEVGQEVTEAMRETLRAAAGDKPALQAAADEITKANRRYYALRTLVDALDMRAQKEATGTGPLVAVAKKALSPTVGGLGGLAYGAANSEGADEDKLSKAALPIAGAAAALGGQAGARALRRLGTTASIALAQRMGAEAAHDATSPLAAELSQRLANIARTGATQQSAKKSTDLSSRLRSLTP